MCVLACLHAGAQLTPKSLIAANKDFIGFYEFKPVDYDAAGSEKYPLIVFLHGYGERGNGTTDLPNVLFNGLPRNISEGHKMRFFWNGKWETFFVMIPQLNKDKYSFWQNFYVDEMIRYAKSNYRIDENRIFLTGLSMGGGGTWSYCGTSLDNAKQFAAIATSCGACQSTDWCNIAKADLPMWSFHAEDDNSAAPVSCTKGTITNIRTNCSPKVDPYMTIWPTGGHGIWGRVYDTDHNWQNPNVYEWFLGQNKSLPINQRPISDAGPDITIATSKATVNLSAVHSKDADGKLVRFVWRKVSGPAAGSIATAVSEDGNTKVTGLTTAGVYQFELKAIDDRADWSLDVVNVTVVSGTTPNIPPVTEAGPNQTVLIPEADLNGGKSYDPDGTVVSYQWTKIDGPPVYKLDGSSTAVPKVSNLLIGDYKFELQATDNLGATTKDTVVIRSLAVVLPVKLKSFSATPSGWGTQLSWTTIDENGDEQFEIEASENGHQFSPIYSAGSAGKSQQQNYSWMHTQGQNYYRLKIISQGKNIYSSIISIHRTAAKTGLEFFPNPVQQTLWVKMSNQERGKISIRIQNLEGKLISETLWNKQQEQLSASVDTRSLHTGIYFVAISNNSGWREVKKIVKK